MYKISNEFVRPVHYDTFFVESSSSEEALNVTITLSNGSSHINESYNQLFTSTHNESAQLVSML